MDGALNGALRPSLLRQPVYRSKRNNCSVPKPADTDAATSVYVSTIPQPEAREVPSSSLANLSIGPRHQLQVGSNKESSAPNTVLGITTPRLEFRRPDISIRSSSPTRVSTCSPLSTSSPTGVSTSSWLSYNSPMGVSTSPPTTVTTSSPMVGSPPTNKLHRPEVNVTPRLVRRKSPSPPPQRGVISRSTESATLVKQLSRTGSEIIERPKPSQVPRIKSIPNPSCATSISEANLLQADKPAMRSGRRRDISPSKNHPVPTTASRKKLSCVKCSTHAGAHNEAIQPPP